MHLHFVRTITIEAPASKVWRVLAHEFGEIGRWASAIPQSHVVTAHASADGAEICGRVCSTAIRGFDAIHETFTYYDEAGMRFGYAASDGRPAWITSAENNWSVRALDLTTSLVEARAELNVRFFPGVVLAPLLRLQMDRAGVQLFEELKYFVEHDQPHPRKLRRQQRQSAKVPAQS